MLSPVSLPARVGHGYPATLCRKRACTSSQRELKTAGSTRTTLAQWTYTFHRSTQRETGSRKKPQQANNNEEQNEGGGKPQARLHDHANRCIVHRTVREDGDRDHVPKCRITDNMTCHTLSPSTPCIRSKKEPFLVNIAAHYLSFVNGLVVHDTPVSLHSRKTLKFREWLE